jgi:catechol 2,3-dioxygenase-like lactoylglutathione lyase family enzyme
VKPTTLLRSATKRGQHATSDNSNNSIGTRASIDLNLEVVPLLVSDVERSKSFYQRLGWRLDADIVVGDDFLTTRLPGREWEEVGDIALLAGVLEETAEHHGAIQAVAPPHDWWDWYAAYFEARRRGNASEAASRAADRYMADVKHVLVPSGSRP